MFFFLPNTVIWYATNDLGMLRLTKVICIVQCLIFYTIRVIVCVFVIWVFGQKVYERFLTVGPVRLQMDGGLILFVAKKFLAYHSHSNLYIQIL